MRINNVMLKKVHYYDIHIKKSNIKPAEED